MEFFIDDENFNNFNENYKTNLNIPKKSNLNGNMLMPVFVSKDDREKLKQNEKLNKEESNNKNKYEFEKPETEEKMNSKYLKNSRSKSSSSERNEKIKINQEKELEKIKNHYLGLNKEKRRIIRPSEKYKHVFNMEWDNSEDTSKDYIPLITGLNQPNLLFGRGNFGGIDPLDKIKKKDKDLKEKHDDSKKLKKRSRSRSRSRDKHRHRKRSESYSDSDSDYSEFGNKQLSKMSDRDWRIFRENYDIIIKGGRAPFPIRNINEAKENKILPRFILDAIEDMNISKLTAIQMQGIPMGLERRDMVGLAPTGSGKTLAYLIPLVVYLNSLPQMTIMNSNLGPYAIIIAPSRELAIQIHDVFKKLAKYTKLRAACLVGGRSSEEQALHLGVGVELIISTPGRIQDSLERAYTVLSQCSYVILDEADTMIKDNFEENLNYILGCLPKERITMMFSATMSPSLDKLSKKYLNNPSTLSIGEPGASKKDIEQSIEFLDEGSKKERLRRILERSPSPIIIFVNHKNSTEYLSKYLNDYKFKACTLHSGKSQDNREKSLEGFKNGKYDIIVCTNVAARGIDVKGVMLVINYDCPYTIDDYIHRIGRTGRANKKGKAITFVTKKDDKIFINLRNFLKSNDQVVPNELIKYIENHNLNA